MLDCIVVLAIEAIVRWCIDDRHPRELQENALLAIQSCYVGVHPNAVDGSILRNNLAEIHRCREDMVRPAGILRTISGTHKLNGNGYHNPKRRLDAALKPSRRRGGYSQEDVPRVLYSGGCGGEEDIHDTYNSCWRRCE